MDLKTSMASKKIGQLALSIMAIVAISGCLPKPTPVVLGKWGYISKTGQWVALPQLDGASNFGPKGAIVFQNKHLMRLNQETMKESDIPVGPDDKAELPALPTAYFAESKDGYKIMEGDTCLFDPATKPKELPPIFAENGLACAKFASQYAFIDKDGKLAVGGRPFAEARPFQDGRAAVKMEGKWGFINKKGSFVIPPKYLDAGSFYGGVAPVKEKWVDPAQ